MAQNFKAMHEEYNQKIISSEYINTDWKEARRDEMGW
jgi:hypothetical protein